MVLDELQDREEFYQEMESETDLLRQQVEASRLVLQSVRFKYM